MNAYEYSPWWSRDSGVREGIKGQSIIFWLSCSASRSNNIIFIIKEQWTSCPVPTARTSPRLTFLASSTKNYPLRWMLCRPFFWHERNPFSTTRTLNFFQLFGSPSLYSRYSYIPEGSSQPFSDPILSELKRALSLLGAFPIPSWVRPQSLRSNFKKASSWPLVVQLLQKQNLRRCP